MCICHLLFICMVCLALGESAFLQADVSQETNSASRGSALSLWSPEHTILKSLVKSGTPQSNCRQHRLFWMNLGICYVLYTVGYILYSHAWIETCVHLVLIQMTAFVCSNSGNITGYVALIGCTVDCIISHRGMVRRQKIIYLTCSPLSGKAVWQVYMQDVSLVCVSRSMYSIIWEGPPWLGFWVKLL